MYGLALLFLPLLAELAALYFLSGYLSRVFMTGLGRYAYLAIMFPGVMTHELSHAAACALTGTKIIRMQLFAPHEESPGRLVLGSVTHVRPRSRLVAAMIGAAPLLGGAIALRLLFAAFGFDPSHPFAFDAGSWTTYLFFWLAIAIAAHLAPSATDLRNAAAGIALLFIGFMAAYGVSSAISPETVVGLLQKTGQFLAPLTAILTFAVVVCAVIAAVFGILFYLTGRFSRR